jgi:hypothetical protein
METRPRSAGETATPAPVLRARREPASLTSATEAVAAVGAPAKRVGYGLPCAKCGMYYTADQSSCPQCRTTERVTARAASLPSVTPAVVPSAAGMPGAIVSTEAIELEREKFLRELKAQVFQAHVQINPGNSVRCGLDANHLEGVPAAAAICQSCYDGAQERSDRLEAALHMDVQDATKLIYEAVWADPSDPNKTYQNAALALLTELRRRAGLPAVLNAKQAYAH